MSRILWTRKSDQNSPWFPRLGLISAVLLLVVLLGVACRRVTSSPASHSKEVMIEGTGPVQVQQGSLPSFTPDQPIRFEHISLEEGLTQSSIYCILQDSRGFLWFGTEDGLNKYDGYTFTHYRHVPDDPHSLSHNHVWTMIEDDEGTLWIGTNGGGLNRFDRDTEQFTQYRGGNSSRDVSGDFIRTIYQDREGTLWIGTEGDGLCRFDRAKEHFVHYYHDPNNFGSLSSNVVHAIYQDRDGVLWIGTDGGGLDRFDPVAEHFFHYQHVPGNPHSLSSNAVRAIFQDREGMLWIGTDDGGLNRFDPDSGQFTRYRHDPYRPDSLGADSVRAIYQDREGLLWFGTFGGGLDLWDPAEPGRFIHHRYDLGNVHSLSSDNLWSIYQDREGLLWIGTHGGGINKFDRTTEPFAHYYARLNDANSLSSNMIWAIYQDREGILWIGTGGGGLNRFDRSTGEVTHYQHIPGDSSSLYSNVVRAIYQDASGTLWLGAEDGGLDRFDRATEQFVHYAPLDSHGDSVLTFYLEQDNVLWIGTAGSGIEWFDLQKEQFVTPHFPDFDCVPGFHVRAIYPDRAGMLWIGASGGGLSRLDREKGSCKVYRHDPQDPGSLSHNMVMSVYEDSAGTLWVATFGGGLNRLDRETGRFVHYRENDGLPNDMVYGILEEKGTGALWLSTNQGLVRFDPQTETFKGYDVNDGLQSNEFNGGAFYKSSSGELFFGGINGVNAFYPGDIKADNTYIPPVVLTYLAQNGEEISLDTAVESASELVVRWPQNFFEFEFAALSYTRPEKNRYAYMLEGLEKDWVYAGNRRFGRYTSLPGGEYVLRLKGANNDGVWNETGAAITIRVIPPFWDTWWFRGLLLLVLIGGVWGGYRLRVRSIQVRSQELESQVQARTAELRRATDQRLRVEEALRQSEMRQAVVAERNRLARDLHDVVTQTLFSASLIAEALPTSWDRDRGEGERLLQELRHLTRGALAEMRTLLLELRPAALIEANLGDLMYQLAEAATGREGIPVDVEIDNLRKLPPDIHITLYRIAQEALNNVTKHARANRVNVQLICTAPASDELDVRVQLCIRDDGRGFNPGEVSADRMGLCSMRERAQAIGATLTIQSEVGCGTKVVLVWEGET